MREEQLSEKEKSELWKDDQFCLYKEVQEMQRENVRIQTDYAMQMGRSFFGG